MSHGNWYAHPRATRTGVSKSPRIAVLLSRVRVEEKLLIQAFSRRGVDVQVIDDRDVIFDVSEEMVFQHDVLRHGRRLSPTE